MQRVERSHQVVRDQRWRHTVPVADVVLPHMFVENLYDSQRVSRLTNQMGPTLGLSCTTLRHGSKVLL